MSVGLLAYALGGLVDAITAFRGVALVTQFTFIDVAQQQLALYGGFSLILLGAIYFAVPRLTGRSWVSGALVSGHAALLLAGVAVLVASLSAAGWAQGHDLLNAKTSFATIAEHTRTWLLLGTAAQGVLLFGNLLLLVNFLQTAWATCCPTEPSAENPFRQPSTLEAPAS